MTAQAAVLYPFPKKAVDFGAALAATKVADTPAAKKGKMPTLTATPEVAAAVDQYQEANASAKKAAAEMEVTGAVITNFVREAQDRDGFAGKFNGSYAVMGNTNTAKVIYANKFTLSADDGPQLAQILGPNFPAMVSKKFTVKLKDEVFESEAKQAELMALLGESFAEFFETKVALAVCEGFNREVYRVLTPADLENLRVYARQYKPSIR